MAENTSNHGGLLNFEPTYYLNEFGFKAKTINGLIYPPFYHDDYVNFLKQNWVTDKNDIFITTHQKVGTHLAKKYISEMLRHTFDYPIESGIYHGDIGHHTIPWPEVLISQYGIDHFFDFIEKTKGFPRVWYLHSYFDDLPFKEIHPESKFIHVYRDPRGVVTSQFHFYKAHPLLYVNNDMDLDSFIDIFLEGNLYFGNYFEHSIDWIINSQKKMNVLNLKYENLVDDKLNTAHKIYNFICPNDTISEKELYSIIEKTEFEKMKKDLKEKPLSFHFNTEKFFRSGKSNGWMTELTPTQQMKIEKVTHQFWSNYQELSYGK